MPAHRSPHPNQHKPQLPAPPAMRYYSRLCILPLLALGLVPGSTKGDVIYESSLLGPRTDSGSLINSQQMLGTRFHLDSPVEVQQIGGAISLSSGTIFGAIFQLSSPTAFPSGNPFDTAPLAVTVFDVGYPLDWDIRVPLDATLAPGDYALMFGSGLYGATGWATATANNIDVPGSSCIWWNGWNPPTSDWYNWDPGFSGPLRFVVEGTLIPEPGFFAVCAVGATLALITGRASRKVSPPQEGGESSN